MSIVETVEPVIETPPPRKAPLANKTLYENTPNGILFEIVDGQRIEKCMSSVERILANVLHEMLYEHLKIHPTGRVWSETMFRIPQSKNDRQPDLAYVSFDTWADDRAIPRVNALPFVPDLAIDVVSPTDRMFDVYTKMGEYFQGGVKSVWLVMSHMQVIQCHTSVLTSRGFGESDELVDEPTLPGLKLNVAAIFPKIDE